MNKRIRLLADEAAKFSAILALPTGESGDKLFVEKFAELIVEECKDLLFESSENNRLPIAVDDMVHIIDTHFGVEE